MVFNPARRAVISEAALEVLGREGARAVTHRAVDAAAGVPQGTCANYFSSRAELFAGMAERIFGLLEPDAVQLARLAALPLSEAEGEYVSHVVERLLRRPELARALIELRLEASRNPDVSGALSEFLRGGFQADVDFHESRGLAGGAQRVLLLHHLVNGIILDAVTISLSPDADPVALARRAARLLLAE
ncbi:MAG: TetR family transcriptional regulator [Arachnia propionica]|uniref:TetR/AcrR family transcriptional regulator n=1 Tax=Arachnia propionica TaxID=1750 RepID=UPI002711A299|nr:TetR family transcriptional regulator [Arachnia propionica]